MIRIWDLETGEVRVLDPGEGRWIASLQFTPEGRLITGGCCSVRIWKADDGTFETLRQAEEAVFRLTVSSDGRLLASYAPGHELRVQDLSSGDSWVISSHGNAPLRALAMDPAGEQAEGATRTGRTRSRRRKLDASAKISR